MFQTPKSINLHFKTCLFLLAFFLLAPAFDLAAQSQQPKWHQYTTEDGLSSMTVYYIHQDREGYIWFATDKGICRFDGYQFEQFPGPDETTSLDVFVIREDSLGRVWFNTMVGGLYYFENDQC